MNSGEQIHTTDINANAALTLNALNAKDDA